MANGLKHSGLPLGGLGTGSVELRADGLLHEWQIMNNGPWGAGPDVDPGPDACYFGLNVKSESRSWSAVLADSPPHGRQLNDPYYLPWLTLPDGIDARQRFPFTELDYSLPGMPVQVRLEAFSPFIPLNAKDSGLPLAFMRFKIANKSGQAVEAAVFCALKNLVGYSEPDCSSVQQFVKTPGGGRLVFIRDGMPESCTSDGSMALQVTCDDARVTSALHARTVRDIWDPLHKVNELENHNFASFVGLTGNERPEAVKMRAVQGLPHGVLCATAPLEPGQEIEVEFRLAWHFPNMWERKAEATEPNCIGHNYSNWFADASEVLDYADANAERLLTETRAFADAFYAGSMPEWFLDAVNAQLTTLVKASWWDLEGRFGIWEGLGCCGLQTTDITHYGSWAIVQFFPEVQFSQMDLTVSNIPRPGKIPHMMPGSFGCCDADPRNRIDLVPQFVLLTWRDILWTGEMERAREVWPVVESALEYARGFDTDGDGLPNNSGPDQTYDQFPLKGTSAFVGYLYAAALCAGADMASRLGMGEKASVLRSRYEDAMGRLHGQLWNGEYFRLAHDPLSGENNEGVMADQVNADWFVRQATGRRLLSDADVQSALRAVLEHCSNPAGYLANCAWPKGGAVEIRRTTADQANCPWSGVEYAVAAHLALMGMQDEALSVARDVWDRYERAGLRFNHIECGGHYYRVMSVWALYLAFAGYVFNAADGELTLDSAARDGDFVFNTPTTWGTLRRKDGRVEVRLEVGSMQLARVRVPGSEAMALVAGAFEARADGEELLLTETVIFKAGDTFSIEVR